MPSFAVKDADLNDTLNYLLAGPTGLNQQNVGLWADTGGYLTLNYDPPYIQSTPPTSIPQEYTWYSTPAYVDTNTTSARDRVLITSQCRPFALFTGTGTWSAYLNIAVRRYTQTFSQQNIGWQVAQIGTDTNLITDASDPNILAGNASLGDTIFTGIVDEPGLGEYFYALEFQWRIISGTVQIDWFYVESHGITVTVIKQ